MLKTTNRNSRKPIAWWRAGLWGGLACPILAVLLTAMQLQTGFFGEMDRGNAHPGFYVIVFMVLLPLITAIAWVALFGNHKNHFMQVQKAGLFGCSILLLFFIACYIYIQDRVDSDIVYELMPVVLVVYAIITIVNTFVWLAFGNWKKYRKQVTEG